MSSWNWLLLSAAIALGVYAAFIAWLVLAGRRERATALARFIPDCVVLFRPPCWKTTAFHGDASCCSVCWSATSRCRSTWCPTSSRSPASSTTRSSSPSRSARILRSGGPQLPARALARPANVAQRPPASRLPTRRSRRLRVSAASAVDCSTRPARTSSAAACEQREHRGHLPLGGEVGAELARRRDRARPAPARRAASPRGRGAARRRSCSAAPRAPRDWPSARPRASIIRSSASPAGRARAAPRRARRGAARGPLDDGLERSSRAAKCA